MSPVTAGTGESGAVAPPVNRYGDAEIQARGHDLIIAIYAAIKALRLYPLENAAVQNALDELNGLARRIAHREGGIVDLRTVGEFIFLSDARLRIELSDYAAFSYVTGMLARHGVGGIEVGQQVTRSEWAPFLSLLLTDPVQEEQSSEDAFLRFAERLSGLAVSHISVSPATERGDLAYQPDDQAKEVAKRTYFQSVHVAREVLTDVRLGRAVNVRRVKRAIQTIVDQVLTNESSILGMTTLRDFDEYTFTHSVNVCILSVILGQKLGLTRIQLYELGLGALFHDLGKMRLELEVVNKPGPITDEEWAQIREHPTEGLLAVFGLRGFGEPPYRAMLIAYEHHMKVDLTGYPRNRREREPTLFSRIVHVADGFDAGTSQRSYHTAMTPPEVLREMRDNRARGYDPLLVRALINVTGILPVGTLVILDTHELAVVVGRNPNPAKPHQPLAKIISDAMGIPHAQPVSVDLSEVDPATGAPRRTVIRTVEPEKYGVNVGEYFV
jgi:HD-GYP domain-containing protein (c-di-GMP phosphodiesterase class II)